MKLKFLLLSTAFMVFVFRSFGQTNYINPQGTYDMVSKTQVKKGETYGRFGSIAVKMISETEVFVQIDVNRGAPSYNMGMLDGTFEYKDNQVICSTEDDASCRIILSFSKKGITVVQQAADINMSCGFGHAVYADGFYKKLSSVYTPIERF